MTLVIPSPFAGLVIPRARGVSIPPVTSIAFQSSAISTGAGNDTTITAPSDIIAGDLLVLLDRAYNDPVLSVIPTNFTSIVESFVDFGGGEGIRQNVSYKIATGSEASSAITGMAPAIGSKVMLVFRPNGLITTVMASTPNAQVTNANPAAQNVAASGQSTPLVVIGCYGSEGVINPRTFSPAKDGEVDASLPANLFNNLWMAYKIYNSSPANVSIDMDDEGNSNVLQSFYLRLS